MIKKLTLLIMLIVFTAVLIGCNTMHGLGKDIESLGQAMKQSSKKS